MTSRKWLGVLAAAGTAATALGASFTWTGGHGSNWTDCGSWSYTGLPSSCYPSTKSDDVTIPVRQGGGGWTIDLVNIDQVDDITIFESVDFGPVSGTPTLKCDTLTIEASNAEEIILTFDGATISG
ncbi:hypothetical protein RAS1_19480 [Phycisphaerae bacterium RAS1]|nr:hypothetical protein RAS1_19480 [Phycisphaerae bacterium RAS1]